MYRIVFWFCLLEVGLGFAVSALLVVRSLRPEPGAGMILMGLECVALLILPCALVAVGIASNGDGVLSRWEKRAGVVAGGLALAVFGALAILG